MSPRLTLAVLALLGQTGCVAAIPMATQLVSGANSTTQLCSLAKIPGQSGSLCDRLPFNSAQAQATATDQTVRHTAVQ